MVDKHCQEEKKKKQVLSNKLSEPLNCRSFVFSKTYNVNISPKSTCKVDEKLLSTERFLVLVNQNKIINSSFCDVPTTGAKQGTEFQKHHPCWLQTYRRHIVPSCISKPPADIEEVEGNNYVTVLLLGGPTMTKATFIKENTLLGP